MAAPAEVLAPLYEFAESLNALMPHNVLAAILSGGQGGLPPSSVQRHKWDTGGKAAVIYHQYLPHTAGQVVAYSASGFIPVYIIPAFDAVMGFTTSYWRSHRLKAGQRALIATFGTADGYVMDFKQYEPPPDYVPPRGGRGAYARRI